MASAGLAFAGVGLSAVEIGGAASCFISGGLGCGVAGAAGAANLGVSGLSTALSCSGGGSSQCAWSAGATTSQGLFNAAMGGIGSAIGGFSGGLLIESLGAKGMYMVYFGFVALVLVVVSVIHWVLPPEQEAVAQVDSV